MYRVFRGANGYYVAWENADGFHHQPPDGGSWIGWDRQAADAILRQIILDAQEEEDYREEITWDEYR